MRQHSKCNYTPAPHPPKNRRGTLVLPERDDFQLCIAFEEPIRDPSRARSLPELLRLRRQNLMLGQKEVARLAGVNEMSIVGWENGWHTPRLGKLRPVLEVLGIDEEEALDRR